MKNLHLPLPDDTYLELQSEAQRRRVPATSVARQALQAWLRARKKAAQRQAIAVYAVGMAGTELDFDRSLGRATVELLLESE